MSIRILIVALALVKYSKLIKINKLYFNVIIFIVIIKYEKHSKSE